MNEFDGDSHNEMWMETMYENAQQAITEADYQKVQLLMKELSDAGYVTAAQMLSKQWEDAGNVEVK